MSPREIWGALQKAEAALHREKPSEEGRALLALRDLLFSFLEATDGPSGYPDSMKAMSIDQIRILNQLHLAVGL